MNSSAFYSITKYLNEVKIRKRNQIFIFLNPDEQMEPTYCDPEEVSLSSQMLNHRYRHKYVNQRDSTLQRSEVLFPNVVQKCSNTPPTLVMETFTARKLYSKYHFKRRKFACLQ